MVCLFRSDTRGVRVVTNAERNAVDVDALTDERRCPRTAKSCGSGAPMLGAKFSLIAPKATRGRRWQTQWFTEKSTYKP